MSEAPFDTLNLKRGVGDADERVIANRMAVSEELGIDPNWLEAEQVHGSKVFVHPDGEGADQPADALVTAIPDVPLAIFTADCAPVALLSTRQVGVAHVGWRGLASGLIDRVLDAIGGQDIRAWVGPTIGPCHYEVGTDVPRAFEGRYPSAPSFIQRREGGRFFDLPGAVAWALSSRGVEVRSELAHCTFCDTRFFSYRRDGLTGRQGALVWKVP